MGRSYPSISPGFASIVDVHIYIYVCVCVCVCVCTSTILAKPGEIDGKVPSKKKCMPHMTFAVDLSTKYIVLFLIKLS